MSKKKQTSKSRNKQIERKMYRAAEKRSIRGEHPRAVRTMSYSTPATMRKDTLPIDVEN